MKHPIALFMLLSLLLLPGWGAFAASGTQNPAPSSVPRRVCPNPKCRALVPIWDRYCQYCGTRMPVNRDAVRLAKEALNSFLGLDLTHAEATGRKAVKADPSNAFARAVLGYILVEMDQRRTIGEGFLEIKNALKLDGKCSLAHVAFGLYHYQNDHFEAAEHEYQVAIKYDSRSYFAHHDLGWLYLSQNRLDDAARMLERAIQLRPEVATSYAALGEVFANQDKLDDAERMLKRAVELAPKVPGNYATLGALYLKRRDWASMEAVCREAVRIAPSRGQFHAELCRALFEQGKMDEARQEARTAVELKYRDSHFLDWKKQNLDAAADHEPSSADR